MARIRLIKPSFFRSIELYRTELLANKNRKSHYLNIRVAFAGLWTAADREGRFPWSTEELKLDCLPYDPVDFREVLKILMTSGSPPFIVPYKAGGKDCGYIPGLIRHQRFHANESPSILPPPPADILTRKPAPEKPKPEPKAEPKPEPEPESETLGPTPKDTPAQSCIWNLASVCGITFRNKAEVRVYFKKHIAAAHELMKLAGGDSGLAHRAIVDIWAWLIKKAGAGEISAPENLQAVVNNYLKWRQEYDKIKTEQGMSGEEF